MLGLRPTATSTTSASSVALSPPATGSMLRRTPSLVRSAPVTLVPSLKAIFWRLSSRCIWVATSPSIPGRMRSRNSITVTLAPSRLHTEPISRPM